MKTLCCNARYVRMGRATYVCSECGEDVSLELVFRIDAEEKHKDLKLLPKDLKLVRQSSVRDHMDAYKRDEISYSKMVSLINEDANKELKKKKKKKSEE